MADNSLFNENNVLITDAQLHAFMKKYGVTKHHHDVNIYRKALLHRSYCTRKNDNFINGNIECPSNCLPLQEESNQRLEFLGDAVLNFVVGDYLYQRYPDVNEGFLTRIRTRLVNGNMLAWLAEKMDLGKYLVISKPIEQNNGRANKKILEDAFEAFLGAIYMDYNSFKINTSGKMAAIDNSGIGFQIVYTFIQNVLEMYVDFPDLVHQKDNPKDKFMKQCQHIYQWTPKLLEVDVTEEDNVKIHTICIRNKNNDVVAIGKGCSRKVAEINACSTALDYYGWT